MLFCSLGFLSAPPINIRITNYKKNLGWFNATFNVTCTVTYTKIRGNNNAQLTVKYKRLEGFTGFKNLLLLPVSQSELRKPYGMEGEMYSRN